MSEGGHFNILKPYKRYTPKELKEIGESTFRNVPLRKAQDNIPIINVDFWKLYDNDSIAV